MKKTIMLTLVLILSLVSFTNAFAAIVEPAPENTQALCTNGEDDNGNGMTDFQDVDCAAFAPTPVFVENTLALCTDGEDNNGNGTVDFQDAECSAFAPAPVFVENTQVLCTDGEDNNGNGMTDFQDIDCAAFAPAATTTTPTPNGGTSGPSFGGGSSSGGSSFGSGITSGTPISTVISTSTFGTCADVFTTYMRKGRTNNVTEVKRLQRLLGVKQTGFFGTLTYNAVSAFQLKYTDTVLKPWGISYATGYFYKTTQRQMNMLLCPNVDFPMPVLN